MNLAEAHDQVSDAALDLILAVGFLQSAMSKLEECNNRLQAVRNDGIPLVSDNGCDFPTTSKSLLNLVLNAYGKGLRAVDGLNSIVNAR